MKRITYICAILLSSVLMFSCSDYLEAPPSVDLDEETLILRHVPEAKPILCGLWSSGKEYIDMVDCL